MSNRKLTSPHCPHCGKPIAAPRKPAAGMTAEQFFDARNIACANAGADWHLADSAWFTIPNKLRSFKTARGTTIKCHRDGRLPAARHWPNGTLPAGLEPAAVSTRSPAELHRGYAARCAEWRDTAREMALIAFRARKRGEFSRWKHDARQHETARLTALSYAAELERAAPEPVAAPEPAPIAAPIAPEPIAEPIAEPAPVAAPDNNLAAVWDYAVAAWRAYQSPADELALLQYRTAGKQLLAYLIVPPSADGMAQANATERLFRAIKRGTPFPAAWFKGSAT